MKRAVSIGVLLAFLTVIGWGQVVNIVQQSWIGPVAPPPAGVTAQATVARGSVNLYYWVTARYPSGVSIPAGPGRAIGTVGVAGLGAAPVRVAWPAAPGATGYDVIRLVTMNFPTNSTCVNCVVSSNQAGITFLDVGGGVVNFPTAGTVYARGITQNWLFNNRDDNYPFFAVNGEVHVNPTRSTNAYGYLYEILGSMTGGAAQKTYALGINVTRPAGSVATGDSNDALIRGSYSNYATNDANFILRGINTSVTNRSPGTLGVTEAANISAANRSGATSPQVRGMMLSMENYGVVADQFSGLTVALKNEAAKATLEYGVKVQNDNNSLGTAADAAYMVRGSAGLTNTGFQYGLDMNGATIGTAEVRTSRGNVIYSGNGAPGAGLCAAPTLGSIYLNLGGGAGTSLYVCEVAGAWVGK